jgi:hypothetical protein
VPVPRGGQPVGLCQQATDIGCAVRGSIGAHQTSGTCPAGYADGAKNQASMA